jgi:RimJ/RimL family protein N-acetyltransferase
MLLSNQGRRIFLRALEPDDADWLAKAYQNNEFARLYRANAEVEPAERIRQTLVDRNNLGPEEIGSIEFLAVHYSMGPVGLVGVVDYSSLHRRAEFLVGIVDKSHRRSSLAVEATLLALDLVFNHYELHKLYTYVYGYNDYAEKNTLKVGFRQEGLLKGHHYCRYENRFVDLYVNGMTDEDFRTSATLARLSQRLIGRNITRASRRVALDQAQEIAVPDVALLEKQLRNLTVGR